MPEETQRLPFDSGSRVATRTAIAFAIVALAIGFAIGATINAGGRANSLSGAPEEVDFSPVWKAWRAIDEKFVPASVATSTESATSTEDSNQKKVWGMIQGLADSLEDPYSFFLPPKENEQFEQDIKGAFEGVGMEIAVKDQVLTVVSPLKGTPAERAGIKSGDKILKIDGGDTTGLDVSTAVSRIRGPKGTQVKLLIMRDSFTAPREFNVTREVINVPAVETEARPDGIFVIELKSFTANSPGLFRLALREFVESKRTRLILDMRGNPGGYLDAAVDMASWFLPSGNIVVSEHYGGNAPDTVHRSRGYDVFNENLRMVILVDKGSASASEILAGALRHYGVAQMVGDRTFGKGSVQEVIDITSDTALKLTVAQWIGPDGKAIPHEGLEPDVLVENKEADVTADRDPQLERAAQILLGQ